LARDAKCTAFGGRSQLTHQTAVQRLAHAGAVPNTSLALVTELFRDWDSPLGAKAKEVIKGECAGVCVNVSGEVAEWAPATENATIRQAIVVVLRAFDTFSGNSITSASWVCKQSDWEIMAPIFACRLQVL
jgi:hypothetical protein